MLIEQENPDLISASEARKILHLSSNASLYNYVQQGRLSQVRREALPGEKTMKGRLVRIFFSKNEVLQLRKEEKLLEGKIRIDEVRKLTGLSYSQIMNLMKMGDIPHVKIQRGKQFRNFFDKKTILQWMKLREGEIPEDKSLLNTAQVSKMTGYSVKYLLDNVRMGTLKYAHRSPSNRKNKFATFALTQGYWFRFGDVLKWKEEQDKRLLRRREANAEKLSPSQVSKPSPDKPFEISLEDFDEKAFDSGEKALRILQNLQERMIVLLQEKVSLRIQDVYELIRAFVSIKNELSSLRSEGIKFEGNGRLSKTFLGKLETWLDKRISSGAAILPSDIWYLARTESFVRDEKRKLEAATIEGTSLSADDLLLEVIEKENDS